MRAENACVNEVRMSAKGGGSVKLRVAMKASTKSQRNRPKEMSYFLGGPENEALPLLPSLSDTELQALLREYVNTNDLNLTRERARSLIELGTFYLASSTGLSLSHQSISFRARQDRQGVLVPGASRLGQ